MEIMMDDVYGKSAQKWKDVVSDMHKKRLQVVCSAVQVGGFEHQDAEQIVKELRMDPKWLNSTADLYLKNFVLTDKKARKLLDDHLLKSLRKLNAEKQENCESMVYAV